MLDFSSVSDFSVDLAGASDLHWPILTRRVSLHADLYPKLLITTSIASARNRSKNHHFVLTEQPERGGGETNRGEASMRNNNNDNNFEGKRRTKEAVKRIMRADLKVITSKVSPAKIKTPTIINLLGKKVTTDTILNKSKNSNRTPLSV
ncbi:hypothetical protein HID58_038254 [Brassica napus]|uniref:Uncharacterized protein n=1 Tax=Brassica napus TaxID=3708 RepID=A0ABQ8BPJ2_BRANA|nr:hypothetical protein HID58_038254 [Brassica napus]